MPNPSKKKFAVISSEKIHQWRKKKKGMKRILVVVEGEREMGEYIYVEYIKFLE